MSAEVRAEIARTQSVTVSGLAARLGIRRATLAAKVNGQAAFRPSELHRVALALGTTASELVRRAEAALARDAEPAAAGPAA